MAGTDRAVMAPLRRTWFGETASGPTMVGEIGCARNQGVLALPGTRTAGKPLGGSGDVGVCAGPPLRRPPPISILADNPVYYGIVLPSWQPPSIHPLERMKRRSSCRRQGRGQNRPQCVHRTSTGQVPGSSLGLPNGTSSGTLRLPRSPSSVLGGGPGIERARAVVRVQPLA